MHPELNLEFSTENNVIVHFNEQHSEPLAFESPVTEDDQKDIHWYLEVYAYLYTTDVDDARAAKIAARLPILGEKLLNSVCYDDKAAKLFQQFHRQPNVGRLLTISASHPAILSLPWELLRVPQGPYLFHDKPRISIRRRLANLAEAKKPLAVTAKTRLHLLFVVSRPEGASFIDPRADAIAVLEALAQTGPMIEVEFLRPATLANLRARLTDNTKPPIDIFHFDGHGVFDAKESMGYLLFTAQGSWTKHRVPATGLGLILGAANIPLVILSACQSAAIGDSEEPMGTVAVQLTHAGVPSVIAMTHSVHVNATRALFSAFYQHLTQGKGVGEALDNARSHLYQHPDRIELQRGQEHVTLKLYDWFLPALYQAGEDTPFVSGMRNDFPKPHQRDEDTTDVSGMRNDFPKPHQRDEDTTVVSGMRNDFPKPHQRDEDTTAVSGMRNDFPKPHQREENATDVSGMRNDFPKAHQRDEDTTDVSGMRNDFPKPHNLPSIQPAGFWGRTQELWQIECAFVQDETRRFTISGFGGQGKTYLAIEAGQWLYRTGLFENVCLVDYASFQGVDAVGLAVSTLATVLEKSLVDAEAATAALAQQPTLLILDNLEAITTESLTELLTVAQQWSEIGECRVLLTTRTPDFHHPDYPTKDSLIHQSLALTGLAEDDALAYFQRLLQLPPAPEVALPTREAVLALFKQVSCHPLSIGLIAAQLKVREIAELGTRLEILLAESPDNPLLASLNLSLDRLDEEARRLLPKLGVFQGGALLYNLIAVTELSESQWQKLLPALISVGLIQAEDLGSHEDWGGNIIYLKFHPTLAPALWTRIGSEEQAQLQARHRQRYYEVSRYLYFEDSKNPNEIRAIAQRELPNLLLAVHGILDAEEAYALEFVEQVNRFLNLFGLNRDSKVLSQRIEHLDDFLALRNKGEQLYHARQYQDAAQMFSKILKGLDEQASYNRCITLNWLGRCFYKQGQVAQAVEYYYQSLAVAKQLESSQDVKRQMSVLQTDLADALRDMGDYDGARKSYEKSLAIKDGDARGKAVVLVQLGVLALRQDDLQEATQRYTEALAIFHRLNEPKAEAEIHFKVGEVYLRAEQWEAAEQAYREVARISESQGNQAYEAWNNLALVTQLAGKPEETEAWYRKILKHREFLPDKGGRVFNNLANLLLTHYPNRLAEARQLMEEALANLEKLNPAIAEIWKSYNLLAQIAEKQNDTAKASEYRRQSRKAYQGFQGARYQLQKHRKLIAGVVAAVNHVEVRKGLELALEQIAKKPNWENIAAAIQRILDGERDEEVLCEPLSYKEGAIINAILSEIAGDFQDSQSQPQQFLESLIAGVVAAVDDAKVRQELESSALKKAAPHWKNLADAIQRILDGERDEAVLCEPLNSGEAAIINAILRGIAEKA